MQYAFYVQFSEYFKVKDGDQLLCDPGSFQDVEEFESFLSLNDVHIILAVHATHCGPLLQGEWSMQVHYNTMLRHLKE